MTFWSYMGHRLLGGVLGVFGFIMAVGGFAVGSIISGMIGVVLMVAAAYFFKTQH